MTRAGPGRLSIEPVSNPLRSASDPVDIPRQPPGGGKGEAEPPLGGGNSSDNPSSLGTYKTAKARRMSGRVLATQTAKGGGNSVLMGSGGGRAGPGQGGNSPPSSIPETSTDFESSTAWMRGPDDAGTEAADAGRITTRRQQRGQTTAPAAPAAAARAGVGSVALGITKPGSGSKTGGPSGSYRRASVAVSRQQQAAARFAAERAERAARDVVADVDVGEL